MVAGKRAIYETAISRFVLPAPVMFVPTILNFCMTKLRLMPKHQILRNTLELSFCTLSLLVGLPLSVALFKQQSVIKKEDLEPAFHNVKDKDGAIINEFYFNRGL